MKSLDKYNMINILNRDLERGIKEASIDAITKNFLAEFEAKIRPLIKKEVERMSFDAIDQIQDMMQIREEFNLYIKWSDEEDETIVEKS